MRNGPPPPTPTGSDNHATWARWVTESLCRLKFVSTSSVKVSEGRGGIGFEADIPPQTKASSSLVLMNVTTVYGKYLRCLDAKGKVYRVMKPFHIQSGVDGSGVYGVLVNYTYPNDGGPPGATVKTNTSRVASISTIPGITQLELIIPPYGTYLGPFQLGVSVNALTTISAWQCGAVGVVTEAADTLDGNVAGTPVTWLDANGGGRAWAAAANQNL